VVDQILEKDKLMDNIYQKIIWEILKYKYGNARIEDVKGVYDSKYDQGIIDLADRLRINGVLFHIFQREEVSKIISKELAAYVEKDTKRIAMENQYLEMQGIELLKVFQANHIPVLWLKGNPNMQWIYGDYTTRSTSDLDFLIRKEDRMRAAELMKGQGFSYPQEIMDQKGVIFTEEEYANWAHEMHYRKHTPVMVLNLDLHLEVTGFPQGTIPKTLYHLDNRDWFNQVETMELRGERVPVLKKEDALMLMIDHYSVHHTFCGLKWLLDLCEVMVNQQDHVDWKYLKETYDHPNERKLMGICFRMVEELTGVDRFGDEPWAFYWPDRNTDYEYRIYQSFTFENTKGWKKKVQGRLAKILIPASAKDRRKMAYYYFGSGEALAQRTGRKPGGNPFGHIFAVIHLYWKERKKRR